MPKAAPNSNGPKASANRAEPYTKSPPTNGHNKSNKENVDPKAQSSKKSDNDRGDYRDILLDEIKGEVPWYVFSQQAIPQPAFLRSNYAQETPDRQIYHPWL